MSDPAFLRIIVRHFSENLETHNPSLYRTFPRPLRRLQRLLRPQLWQPRRDYLNLPHFLSGEGMQRLQEVAEEASGLVQEEVGVSPLAEDVEGVGGAVESIGIEKSLI